MDGARRGVGAWRATGVGLLAPRYDRHMAVLEETFPPVLDRIGTQSDEAAARGALREQIARLERQLADVVVSGFPHVALAPAIAADAPAPRRTPRARVLSLGELEQQRDRLAGRLREAGALPEAHGAQVEANKVLLERMLLGPKRHKFARLHRSDVGMGGCGAYQVRPRLGIIGMLMGWWQVKLSSGCPLAA